MLFIMRFFSLILLVNLVFACSTAEPAATGYKQALTNESASAAPSNNPAATPGTGNDAGSAGNAQNGLAILGANCDTAGCHKDNGITLTKTTVIVDATAAKGVHKGVQPVFTATNIADIKAALAGR